MTREHCPATKRRAVLRMLALVRDVPRGSVAEWDQRTSLNDARTALSLACGGRPDEINPSDGTWDGP